MPSCGTKYTVYGGTYSTSLSVDVSYIANQANYESPCELATLATSSSMDSCSPPSDSARLSLSESSCALAAANLDSAPPPPPPPLPALPAVVPAPPDFLDAAHAWA